jgi:O-antigen/teichoic acid export membrane protein
MAAAGRGRPPLAPRAALAWIAGQRGILVGFLAQALQYGASLLLLPLMLHRLSTAEIGIWYLLLAAQGFAVVADFGFGGAFSRNIAAAMAGARDVQAVGLAGHEGDSRPNYPLVAQIVRVAQMWYFLLSVAVLLLMLTGGLWYVTRLADGQAVRLGQVQLSWAVMSFTIAVSMYFSWVNPILIGAGRVQQDMVTQIINRGGFALLGAAALLAGGGLLGLACAQLAAVALGRIAAARFLRPITVHLPPTQRGEAELRRVFARIAPNAGRSGLVGVSGFVITRFNLFAVTSFVGLEAGASFAVSFQLISSAVAVAQIPFQFSGPKLVGANVRGDKAVVRQTAMGLTLTYFLLFVSGALVVMIAGPLLLRLIGSHARLLPTPELALLTLVLLLEGIHSISAAVIATMNKVPFVAAALLSAVAVALGSILVGWWGGGVAGIIACQGLVQLLYNNWKWPLVLWQETAT